MCSNLKPIELKEAIVYKLIAKKKARSIRYYSVAMGFKYPKKAGKIPRIKAQHCIAFFDRDILEEHSNGYSKNMIGRTAGFISQHHAAAELDDWCRWARIFNDSFSFHIVKAKLTDGLMSGRYGGQSIIAGRHIEFLE